MNVNIIRENILHPLQQVTGAIERRQTMPSLANVYIQGQRETITFIATDLEIELIAQLQQPFETDFAITVPAQKLLDIVKNLPEGADVNFQFDKEGRVIVRSGRSRFVLSTLPADDFPLIDNIEFGQETILTQQQLLQVIQRTSFSMARHDVRYFLNGLLIELKNKMIRGVATDGHRLALAEIALDDEVDHHQVIVPRKAINELQRLLVDTDDAVSLQFSANHIRLKFNDLIFTSKLIDGRFPDYERVLPQGGDKQLHLDRLSLRQALVRTAILSNEKYKGVRLSLNDGSLSIQSHNPDQEEAQEDIVLDYQGEALEIGFNVTYLLEVLNALNSHDVEITLKDTNSSCLINTVDDKSARYVVMPMRL